MTTGKHAMALRGGCARARLSGYLEARQLYRQDGSVRSS